MFSFNSQENMKFDSEFITYFCVAILFSFFAFGKWGQRIQNAVYFKEYSNTRHIAVCGSCLILFLLSVSSITSSGFNPFIYFRF